MFADGGIGGFPEVGDVGGDLDGALVGGEDLDEDFDAAGAEGEVFFEAVEVLDAGGDGGGSVFGVGDFGLAAGGEGDLFGGELGDEGLLFGGEPVAEGGEDGFFFDFFEGNGAVADLFDEVAFVFGGEGGEGEFGHPAGEAVDAGDPLVDGVVPVFEGGASGENFFGEDRGGFFGGGFAAGFGFEEEIAEEGLFLGDDAF